MMLSHWRQILQLWMCVCVVCTSRQFGYQRTEYTRKKRSQGKMPVNAQTHTHTHTWKTVNGHVTSVGKAIQEVPRPKKDSLPPSVRPSSEWLLMENLLLIWSAGDFFVEARGREGDSVGGLADPQWETFLPHSLIPKPWPASTVLKTASFRTRFDPTKKTWAPL